MTTQLQLSFFEPPHASHEDESALIEWLRGKSWCKAKEISHAFPGWNERKVRMVASESSGRILSGQAGYKLTLECTPEEVHHATHWLRSQAKLMTQRSIDIERVFHRAV